MGEPVTVMPQYERTSKCYWQAMVDGQMIRCCWNPQKQMIELWKKKSRKRHHITMGQLVDAANGQYRLPLVLGIQ